MSDITFQMTADDGDVLKSIRAIGTETDKLRSQIGLLGATAKEQGQAESTLYQQRIQSLQGIMSKQNELKQQMQQLREAHKAGSLSSEELREGTAKLSRESEQLTGQLNRLRAAVTQDTADQKLAAKVIGDSENATERFNRRLSELNRLREKGLLTAKQHAAAIEAEQKKTDENAQSTSVFGSSLSGVAAKLGAAAAGFVSVQQAVSLVNAEIRNTLEIQGKAADATVELGKEQEALLPNLGGANAAEVAAKLRGVSAKTGIKQADITRAVNESMAARGDFDVQQVIQAVGAVGRIRKFAPSEMAGLAASTIDTQRQTGLGTDQALGFLLQLQGQSRTKSLQELSANVVPGVGGVMQMGADRQTAGALIAALSQGMGDTSGATSRTAALALAGQLREFGGGAPIADTLKKLQADATMRQQFLSGASFEIQARPSVESLLSGGRVSQNFASARQALGQDPVQALLQAERDRAAFGQIGLAEQQLGFANAANQAALSNRKGAESAIVRRGLDELMQSMPGNSAAVTRVKSILREFDSGNNLSFSSAVGELTQTVQQRRRGIDQSALRDGTLMDTLFGFAGAVGPSGAEVIGRRNLRDEEFTKQTEQFAEAVKLLQQLVDQTAQNKDAGAMVGRATQVEGRR